MRKLRILNIVTDEKFIDNVITFHDLSSDKAVHDYVVVSADPVNFKLIKHSDRIKRIAPNDFLFLLEKGNYDAVLLHSLLALPTHLVPPIPSDVAVIWSSWGYDLYQSPQNHPLIELKEIYRPVTRQALKALSSTSLKGQLKYYLKKIRALKRFRCRKERKAILKAAGRVNFFACVLSPEYELAKRIKGFKAEYVDYKYYEPSRLNSFLPEYSKTNSILIGNSAAASNNHIDIFKKINNIDLSGREIIIPINYGANEKWKDIVQKKANQLVGGKLKVIRDYMPISEYFATIGKCSHAIFFHERQQALGNIYFLLETGSKIFLSETSVTYRYLKNLGITVYSVQSELNRDSLRNPLTQEEIILNREKVRKICSDKKRAMATMYNLYEKIANWKTGMK